MIYADDCLLSLELHLPEKKRITFFNQFSFSRGWVKLGEKFNYQMSDSDIELVEEDTTFETMAKSYQSLMTQIENGFGGWRKENFSIYKS